MKRVIICGGGTAGWMTAAALSKAFCPNIEVILIESDEIPTVGVGEATIPPLLTFHKLLGISEAEFMAATGATFKLGIEFKNWGQIGDSYIHSFGFPARDSWTCTFNHFWLEAQRRQLSDVPYGDYVVEHLAARRGKFSLSPQQTLNYAYHLDAGAYAKFLRKISEEQGVYRHEGRIERVECSPDTGNITSIHLVDGEIVDADFFIDCTGFRSLLLGQTLNVRFENWQHWLPCDRAVAAQTEGSSELIPYTRATAHESGWQWRIPLQHRRGNGLVYASEYLASDSAEQLLLNNIDGPPLKDPRHLKFCAGTRAHHWQKNCVAIGLSSGFLEPLESTSIHLIQRSILNLIKCFPSTSDANTESHAFNCQMREEIEAIRDFIILHYKVTTRDDSEFWRYCQHMPIPDSLAHRIELFKESGRVFKVGQELFGEESWIQVMMGQGLVPDSTHPHVSLMSDRELSQFLQETAHHVNQRVNQLAAHEQFIAYYCQSSQ